MKRLLSILSGILLTLTVLPANGKTFQVEPGGKDVKIKYDRQVHSQKKLCFACRSETDLAVLEVSLYLKGEAAPRIKKLKVEKSSIYRNIILNLDTDFDLGDAFWTIKDVSFSAKDAKVDVKDVRIISIAELSGDAKFLVVPAERKKTPEAPADVVRVFFDMDNLDGAQAYPGRRSGHPVIQHRDPVPYRGFRERILKGSEALIRLVDSPNEADVIVYSRADSKVSRGVLEAVKKGKRLIIYGYPKNKEIAELAPLKLTMREHRGFPVRSKLKRVIPRHWLFADSRIANVDYGQYFDSKLRHGKTVALFKDRSPAVAENGKILQFAFGIGPALIENGPWYDAGLLRAVIGNSPKKLARLNAEGKKNLSESRKAERGIIRSVLGHDDPRYDVGVSEDNFGRFGWDVGEGLLCSLLGNDLSITNGEQYFRFESANNRESRFINDWQAKVIAGNITLSSTNDPTRPWRGTGTVEYTAEMSFDPAWKNKPLSFEVDKGIDDTDVVSINGVTIGGTGIDTPQYWKKPRRYPIPAKVIRWGEKNRIVVRNTNLRGAAGFNSRPLIRIGAKDTGPLPELSVPYANWVAKEYRIRNGKTIDNVTISLLTPFTQFKFGRDRINMILEDRTAQYGAYSTADGIQIKQLSPDFYERKRDGNWNAPWLLLFRKNWTAGRPILLVFEKQPDSIKAKLNNHYIVGLELQTSGGLGTVAAGWPWGVTPTRSDKWVSKLPPEVLEKIKQSLDLALNFPIACDEIFRVDEKAKQIEVVNKFRFRPVQTAWNTPTKPFVFLPPLIALAVREKLGASVTEPLSNFGINTIHGPLLGKENADTIRYMMPLPEERDFIPVNVAADPELHKMIDAGMDVGLKWSWYGCPVDALSPEFPNGKNRNPENPNINLFGWPLGLGDALQGYCFLNPENRVNLKSRITKRFLAPFELYQYKAFARFREEPFSGIRYPILFPSIRELNTNFTPGFGSTFQFGDCNEACTFMAWIAQMLGDAFGHDRFVRANWSGIKEAMRFSWCINDWSFLSGSLCDNGRGASIDMLNCEYPGMIAFARLARMAKDEAMVRQGLYRAARRAVPTLVRFRAVDYVKESRPDFFYDKDEEVVVTGFYENEIKFLRAPLSAKTSQLQNGCFFFEYSRGVPGSIINLYWKYAQDETQNYLTRYAIPALIQGKDVHLKYTGLKGPVYFDKRALPYRNWAENIYIKNLPKSMKRNYSGMRLGASFGPLLWREHGKISIAESSGINLLSADFDPSRKKLNLKLTARPKATLSLAAGLPLKKAQLNGRMIAVKQDSDGIIKLPVNSRSCKYIITFK